MLVGCSTVFQNQNERYLEDWPEKILDSKLRRQLLQQIKNRGRSRWQFSVANKPNNMWFLMKLLDTTQLNMRNVTNFYIKLSTRSFWKNLFDVSFSSFLIDEVFKSSIKAAFQGTIHKITKKLGSHTSSTKFGLIFKWCENNKKLENSRLLFV